MASSRIRKSSLECCLIYSLFCGKVYVLCFYILYASSLIPRHMLKQMKFCRRIHSHTNAYMCTLSVMHVALSQVICDCLRLSQTASRCSQLIHIPAKHKTYKSALMFNTHKHTHTPTRKHTHVIQGT